MLAVGISNAPRPPNHKTVISAPYAKTCGLSGQYMQILAERQ